MRKYHPDNENGSTEITQQINQEYDALFSILSKEKKPDGQSYTYEENKCFKAVLNEIIGFNMTVEVIYSWIWCLSAYEYKAQLKELGFTWCSKKKAWAWHDEPFNKFHKTEIPLGSIRQKYGSEIISKEVGDFLDRLKQAVISQEKDAIKIFKHVDEEIDKLIESYKEQFSDEQLEEIKDLMYGTALIAEQEGFQLGIRYVCGKTAFILFKNVINYNSIHLKSRS